MNEGSVEEQLYGLGVQDPNELTWLLRKRTQFP